MHTPGQDIDEVISWVEQHFKRSLDIPWLYERQKEALRELLGKFYDENRIRGVFQMPTGVGKTIVAAGLILALYKLKFLRWKDIILYLTPRRTLRRQVEEKFEKVFTPFKEDLYGNGLYIRNVFEVKNLIRDVGRELNCYLSLW